MNPPGLPVCDDERRRASVRRAGLAGIDSVTVDADQRGLTVTLFGTVPPGIDRHSFRIEGGRRVTGIRVVGATVHGCDDGDPATEVHLALDRRGDTSTYRLLALGHAFDTRYATYEFGFRQHCPTGLDCRPSDAPPPPPDRPAPAIDYLTKDYAGFRRLLLDRLALTMPDWHERHVPDLGITLVEILAHVGDRLSYQQDAVAAEAYLDTARLRTSVRRHARLVDYPMHEGCAARTIVCVETDTDLDTDAGEFAFAVVPPGRLPDAGPVIAGDVLRAQGQVCFRPLEDRRIRLRAAHSRIELWAWGNEQCHLPVGATEATLRDGELTEGRVHRVLDLTLGEVLILEEERSPATGARADADPAHRQAVRLTRVTPRIDAVEQVPVVDVAWDPEDALTFPLHLTVRGRTAPLAVARGNAVLVEHGLDNTWGTGAAGPAAPVFTAPGYRAGGKPFAPALPDTGITWSAPFPDPADIAAAQARQLTLLPERARDRIRNLLDAESVAGSGAGKVAGDGSSGSYDGDATAAEDTAAVGDDECALRILFGERTLRAVGFHEDRRRALATLLSRFEYLLDAELRRLDTLIQQARSGYILPKEDVEGELARSWGPDAENVLPDSPLLHGPAARALRTDPRAALPRLLLQPVAPAGGDGPGQGKKQRPAEGRTQQAVRGQAAGSAPWTPCRDLMSCGPRTRHVVAETDDQGIVTLRFGDGRAGCLPAPGTKLRAEYSVGNGRMGNVGPGAINRVAFRTLRPGGITRVRNPLPATGGTDPEPVADVRRAAPREPFRRLLRAITADDYAALAQQQPGIQRAAAALRWNGSWYEADVALDAQGTADVPRDLLDGVRQALHRYRRIGHDVVTGQAVQAPLDVALTVRVDPHHIAGHVKQALLSALRPGPLPGGGRGFFDPDALSFGTPVPASRLIAAVVAVPGVRHAEVTRLRRLHGTGPAVPDDGVLRMRPLEIARLDDDSARPENGLLDLTLEGGR
ncbi:putative baseplate assembly protein [Streptomyces rectiverticillatus]|uniref:putative baseplate assembly protein n=1 Tax=Streptomyces rectiverticillatus TaxID=173860 RepID=UPI0015C356BC|nr:putative baseplate assembly protein [Streptomyces rectiverticillatus]QLE75109.1 putative baseplate assembly protein [Streptomyces rectiverticillatus]